MKKLTRKQAIFFVVFTVLAVVTSAINFSPLLGAENQFFTLFQFLGPIAGGFLGAIAGAASVLIAQTMNFFTGKEVTLLNLLRLLPMVFAAFYFGTRNKKIAAVAPVAAIAIFLAHPVGREVWFFTLFWTIPFVAKLFPQRLFLRSLGATFTAHAVGGAVWIWTVPTTPGLWITLIPIVTVERLLFASGITISYVAMSTVLHRLEHLVGVVVEQQYVLSKKFFTWKALRDII